MRRIFTVFATLLLLAVPAFALSDAEYKELMKDKAFAKADRALTQAWGKVKNSFPNTKAGRAAFERLRKDQRAWIASGRDEEAEALMDREGYPRAKAYARATEMRAGYLPDLAQQCLGEAAPEKAEPEKETPKKAAPERPALKPRKVERSEEEFLAESARREAAEDWADGYPDIGVCVGNSVRLREDPDTESGIVGRVNEGETLILLAETSVDGQRWYAVDHPTEEGTAWVFGRYIETYKGYEAGTPACNMSIQVIMNFGVTPEKARALLGKPVKARQGKFFFDPASQELSEEVLEFSNCQLQYVERHLRHVEVWKRGLAFGGVQVGDPASKLTDILGDPTSEGDEGWDYEVDPRRHLRFELDDGKITRMTWEDYLGG